MSAPRRGAVAIAAIAAIGVLALATLAAVPALAQQATFAVRSLTPEAALRAAQAALAACTKNGHQVAVAVTDRAGHPLVMLRDRHAGPHTPETAAGKAYSALSFKTDTTSLARITQPGEPSSGIRQLPRVVAVGGGWPIESAGSLVGAIGVSGAPGGDADDTCAKAGITAIRDDLEL
ncbi:MAG TPA: heme-binding protein [Ramlibacter sp.]|nr:heme-binding protein [Ramlibacter sp.]